MNRYLAATLVVASLALNIVWATTHVAEFTVCSPAQLKAGNQDNSSQEAECSVLGIFAAFVRAATKPANLIALSAVFIAWLTWSASRETAERQLRAYVFVESCIMHRENTAMRFVATVKNYGQTPAQKALVRTTATIDGVIDCSAKPVGADLAPSENTEIQQWYHPRLMNEAMSRIHLGVVRVEGRISYTDAFGAERWTDFAFVSAKMAREEKIAFMRADTGNDFT